MGLVAAAVQPAGLAGLADREEECRTRAERVIQVESAEDRAALRGLAAGRESVAPRELAGPREPVGPWEPAAKQKPVGRR